MTRLRTHHRRKARHIDREVWRFKQALTRFSKGLRDALIRQFGTGHFIAGFAPASSYARTRAEREELVTEIAVITETQPRFAEWLSTEACTRFDISLVELKRRLLAGDEKVWADVRLMQKI